MAISRFIDLLRSVPSFRLHQLQLVFQNVAHLRCSKILKTSFDTDVPFIHLLHRLCTTFLKRYSYLFDDKICRKCFFLNLCHRTRKNTARNQTNFYKINQRNANSQNIKYQQRLRMKLADERSTSDTRVKKRNYFPTDAMIVRLYEE